jgi:hypothetical protein
MKLCKDCKHWDGDGEFGKCNAPQNMTINVITGEPDRRWKYCTIHRDNPFGLDLVLRACGSRARWFEPRKLQAAE